MTSLAPILPRLNTCLPVAGFIIFVMVSVIFLVMARTINVGVCSTRKQTDSERIYGRYVIVGIVSRECIIAERICGRFVVSFSAFCRVVCREDMRSFCLCRFVPAKKLRAPVVQLSDESVVFCLVLLYCQRLCVGVVQSRDLLLVGWRDSIESVA